MSGDGGNVDQQGENDNGHTAPQIARQCHEILQADIWKKILLQNGNGTEGYNTILKCRRVSPQLKAVAEELLTEPVGKFFRKRQEFAEDPKKYKPLKKASPEQKFERFIVKQRGTRFGTAEEVRLFIAQMESQQNPFPNGCVIFHCDLQQTHNAAGFHNSFGQLVAAYPDTITSLIFDFSFVQSEARLLLRLSQIFQLRNLRKLYVSMKNRAKLDLGMINKLFSNGNFEFQQVPAITQLHLFGFSSNNNCPLMCVFNQIRPLMNTITHLGFEWGPPNQSALEFGEQQIRRFPPPPQLQYLDIVDPSSQLLQHYCVSLESQDAPTLQELSVHFRRTILKQNKLRRSAEEKLDDFLHEETEIIRLFQALDKNQAQTLETLDLNIELEDFEQDQAQYELPLNTDLQYQALTNLKLNYSILNQWMWLVSDLQKKFPSVEVFTVTTSTSCLKDLSGKHVGRKGIYDVVSALWEEFPATSNLREIRVPCYDWILTRNGPLPLGILE